MPAPTIEKEASVGVGAGSAVIARCASRAVAIQNRPCR